MAVGMIALLIFIGLLETAFLQQIPQSIESNASTSSTELWSSTQYPAANFTSTQSIATNFISTKSIVNFASTQSISTDLNATQSIPVDFVPTELISTTTPIHSIPSAQSIFANFSTTPSIFTTSPASQSTTTQSIITDPLWSAYRKCEPGLGQSLVLCDPDNTLGRYFGVKQKIDEILWHMQSDVSCFSFCQSAQTCVRHDDVPIQSGVVAVLIAFSGSDLPDDIEDVASRIYRDSNSMPSQNNETCDNGILLIYSVTTRTLFLYLGNSLNSVFDHLPTHKRRIEPQDLVAYLKEMLEFLQSKPPKISAVGRFSLARSNLGGWEIVIGLIAALLIVAFSAAALFAVCFSNCCGKEIEDRFALSHIDACKMYEKDCKEWSKRARRLARRRAKLMDAMQKPNWRNKVDKAKRRLQKNNSSLGGILSSMSDLESGGVENCKSEPYYIVSEPYAVYNSGHVYPWTTYEEGETVPAHDVGGPYRNSQMGFGTLKRGKETQRRDFYFSE